MEVLMTRIGPFLGSVVLGSMCLWAESADSKFVKEASEGGMAEVELGQLAQEKGQSQAVKDFGSRMVMDHSKANDELKSIAVQDNTPVSTSLSVSDKTLKVKLEALSGSAFDKAYMSAMVKDHQDDIAAFQKEANTGVDPKIRNFASKTLPTLQKHLAMAQEAAATVGAK
jgi:putative membrane protein